MIRNEGVLIIKPWAHCLTSVAASLVALVPTALPFSAVLLLRGHIYTPYCNALNAWHTYTCGLFYDYPAYHHLIGQ